MGDGHAFVGFDVGPQANAVLVKVALVAVEVVLQAVEIDEEGGRVEVFYTHSGLSYFLNESGSRGDKIANQSRRRN